jgi:hypothetical protein
LIAGGLREDRENFVDQRAGEGTFARLQILQLFLDHTAPCLVETEGREFFQNFLVLFV